MDMKRFFLYFMVIAALALAGCGGNGGGAATTPDPTPTPTPMPDPSDVTFPSGATTPMLSAANLLDLKDFTGTVTIGDFDYTCAAKCTVTVADDGTIQAVGGVTVMFSQAYNDRMTAMAQAVFLGILDGKGTKAPTTQDPTTDTDRPGQIAAASRTADAPTELALTAGATGTPGTSLIGTDDLHKDNSTDKYDFTLMEGSATTLGSFNGSVHTRTTKSGTKDTIHLYTDMDEAKGMAYSGYYFSNALDGTSATDTVTDDDVTGTFTARTDEGVTSSDTGGVLVLSGTIKKDNLVFSGSKFPTTPSTFVTIEDDSDTSANERKFEGTLHGIKGMFECDATSCRAELDSDGDLTLTATAGNARWTFTPASTKFGSLIVPGVDHDANYLSFGYWLQEMEVDGKTTYKVGTLYDGSQPYDPDGTGGSTGVAQMGNLTGTATYTGKAAGMYGIKTFNADGTEASLRTGDFTANAELTANFGGNAIAEKEHFLIKGSVKNFMDGGDKIANWTLVLEEANLFTENRETNGSPPSSPTYRLNFDGKTTGGGDWRGSFFGNPPADTGTANTADDYPTGVAGDFTGNFLNGNVIGAFGATN